MKKPFLILYLLCITNLILWLEIFDSYKKDLEVTFLNVGQGDSILIQKDSYQILIDGGPDSKVLNEMGKQMPFWDKELDLVILTHPDYDHLNGILKVIKNYRVKNILWTGVVFDDSWDQWKNLLENEEANVVIAKRGIKIRAGDVLFEILSPLYSLEGIKFEEFNDTSVVGKLTYGKNNLLFTGDISKRIEDSLTEEFDLKANVLKISHHGSKNSSSDKFIEEVNPDVAIIQSGENNFGHPHEETLSRLEKFGINVLRNDTLGSIKLIFNGSDYFIKN